VDQPLIEQRALDIADAVRNGRVEPVKVVDVFLERIDQIDPDIGAFRSLRRDAVRAEAEELGRRSDLAELPFAGVPIAVKDNVDVQGESTRDGSAAFPDVPADEDHELVRRLRAAGALIVGKTNMPEFGLWPMTDSAFGVTHNPWDRRKGAGGSSGGSAAAVAAKMVPLAHGNDGAGSIRIPSSICGTYGIKPGHGVVPTLEHHWFDMTENGPIATSVDDAAVMLSVMAARADFANVSTPDRRLSIAVSTRPPLQGIRVDKAVKEAVMAVAASLGREGHRVIPADPPYNASARTSAIARWFAGAVEDAQERDRSLLEKRTRAHLRAGALALKMGLVRDSQAEKWHERVRPMFEQYDVILMPTLSSVAIDVGPWKERSWLRSVWTSLYFAPFTGLWNFAPFPAASIPASIVNGIPVGVQIVGGPGREATILSLSKEIERLRPWPRHAPL
jgi:amidase